MSVSRTRQFDGIKICYVIDLIGQLFGYDREEMHQ